MFCIFIGKKIAKKPKTIETTSNIINEINILNNTQENEIVENNVEIEEENEQEEKEEQETAKTNSSDPIEQAKEIVQNNWGEDDSVYFSYDGKDDEGNYIICVRDKNSTKALYFYYVDVESGSFDVR